VERAADDLGATRVQVCSPYHRHAASGVPGDFQNQTDIQTLFSEELVTTQSVAGVPVFAGSASGAYQETWQQQDPLDRSFVVRTTLVYESTGVVVGPAYVGVQAAAGQLHFQGPTAYRRDTVAFAGAGVGVPGRSAAAAAGVRQQESPSYCTTEVVVSVQCVTPMPDMPEFPAADTPALP
jgi:hypothetical protein